MFFAIFSNICLVSAPWITDCLLYNVVTRELINAIILTVPLCSISIYLSTSCFVVLILREYFRIINLILLKNSSKEIFNFHLQVCEVISTVNRLYSIPFGYFIIGIVFNTTFALFELYDVLTSLDGRSLNQVLFSVGFAIVQFYYAILAIFFFFCCSSTMREKEKVLEIFEKFQKKSKRDFVHLLQLETTQQKISCGIFDFNMETLYEVRFLF